MGRRKSSSKPQKNHRKNQNDNAVVEVFQLQNLPIRIPVDRAPDNNVPTVAASTTRPTLNRVTVTKPQEPNRPPATRTMSVDRELKSPTSEYHDTNSSLSPNDPAQSHYSLQSNATCYYSAESSQVGSLQDIRRRPSRDHTSDDIGENSTQPQQQQQNPQQSYSNLRPVQLNLRHLEQPATECGRISRSDSVISQSWWRRMRERWQINRNYKPAPPVKDDDVQNNDGQSRQPNFLSRFRRNSMYTVVPVTDDAGYTRPPLAGGNQQQQRRLDDCFTWGNTVLISFLIFFVSLLIGTIIYGFAYY